MKLLRLLFLIIILCISLSYAFSTTSTALHSGQVQLQVTDYSGVERVNYPVTSGIPLPKGAVKDEQHIALYNSQGKEIPLQTTVLSRYWRESVPSGEPDSSIRWILLDFRADVPANGTSYYTLKYGNEIIRYQFPTELNIKKEGDEVVINTGVLRFKVGKNFLSDVKLKTKEVWKKISSSEGGNMTMEIGSPPDTTLPPIVLGKGRNEGHYSTRLDKEVKVEVEDAGPLRAQIKVSGWHVRKDGRRFGPFTLRVNAYAGKSYLKVYHTFVNSDLPERGLIEDVGIHMPLELKGEKSVRYGSEPVEAVEVKREKSYYLLQDSWDSYKLVKGEKEKEYKGQSEGWIDVSGREAGVTAMFRNCAQLFPKEIKYDGKELSIWPYPKDDVGPLDLRRAEEKNLPEFQKYKMEQPVLYGSYLSPVKGVNSKHKFAYAFLQDLKNGNLQEIANHTALGFSRTHEIYFYFHGGRTTNSKIEDFAKASSEPLRAFALNHWYDYTDALGHFGWKDTVSFPLIENYLDKKINWAYRHQNEWFPDHFWGIVNYGGTQSTWEKDNFTGTIVPNQWLWYLGGGWNNFEVDAPKHLLLYYLRSGGNKTFNFMESTVKQMMDVVTAHANLPEFEPPNTTPRWKKGGMNRHEYDPYGGGILENHTWNEGLINYYYLTGYRRAYDVAMEVGDFALRVDGGANRIKQWRLYEKQFDRNASNNWRILLKSYELTGEERFRHEAEKWREFYLNHSPYSYQGLPQATFMTVRYTVPTYALDYRLFGDDRVAEEIMNSARWLADSLKKDASDYFVDKGFLSAALSYDITRGGGPLEDLIKVWWKELKKFERNMPYCTKKDDFTSMDFNEFESMLYYLRACRDAGYTEKTPPK